MAFAAMAAALFAVVHIDLSQFPSIAEACATNGLTDSACTAMARTIGILSVIAYAAVLAVSVAAYRLSETRRMAATAELHSTLVSLCVSAAFGVILIHALALVAGPAYASRGNESEYYAALISIENLLWPLLLQLYVSERNARIRTCLASALLTVMALSPYRSVLLAILVFGFAVPFACLLWHAVRAERPRQYLTRCILQGMLVAVIGIVVAWGGYVDTVTRSPSLLVADQARQARLEAAMKAPADHPRPKTAGRTNARSNGGSAAGPS